MGLKKTLPNPQMWNRYAYVQDNPLKYVDADGKDALAVFLTGDERYRNVSTWDVMMSGETVSDVKREWNDFLDDHRSMTHGMSPFPTSKGEVGITAAMVMVGPLGGPLRGFLGTTFSEARHLLELGARERSRRSRRRSLITLLNTAKKLEPRALFNTCARRTSSIEICAVPRKRCWKTEQRDTRRTATTSSRMSKGTFCRTELPDDR